MFLRTEWHSRTVVRISVTGEVDASNANRLVRYVYRYGANSRRLILDLTDVEFFGVECFSLLDIIAGRCGMAAVAWTLIPSPAVARVLQICDPHRARLSHGLITKQHLNVK
jgi:anti-anti-sigma factor